MPDGRVVCIGGEHEDFYDPDFCIYNDVIVFRPNGEIEIYGYPKATFPPTDFHTATLVGEQIIVVGCLGYTKDRRPGFTPVFSLDTQSYRVSELATKGVAPGWIFEHKGDLSAERIISIRGGQFIELKDGKQRFRRNYEEFALDVQQGMWMRLTERNWRQWSIGQEDGGIFALSHGVRIRDLIPEGLDRLPPTDESSLEARFVLRGVPVRVVAGVRWVEIVVEGELPEEIWRNIPEVFRSRVETLCKKKCVVE